MNIKGCYVYYDPNGGQWKDGTTTPKPSPTEGGILHDKDKFVFPADTNDLRRDGYRLHTSISFFNVPRYYTGDGKGGGINVDRNYNNYFGYDCWPWNSMDLTNGGHDENYFSQDGLGLSDGDKVTFFACWDPLVIYHINDTDIRDFVYITSGNEYTILSPGDNTRYATNRSDSTIDGWTGPNFLPNCEKNLSFWKDTNENIFIPHNTYNVTETLNLYPVWKE